MTSRTVVARRAIWAPSAVQCALQRAEDQNIAQRVRQLGEACFRFLATPGNGPTNNLAEPAIRFVVLDRRVTQRAHIEKGRRWNERIRTAIATCTHQGSSRLEHLHQYHRRPLVPQDHTFTAPRWSVNGCDKERVEAGLGTGTSIGISRVQQNSLANSGGIRIIIAASRASPA